MSGIHFEEARGPDGIRLYAIGDVHGCRDHLAEMHRLIHAEIISDKPADWRIIHLGDYVDRGPDSRGVIDFLIGAMQADDRVLALAGNHDVGFLEFLAEPDPYGLFARYGGLETARSYGVEIDLADADRFRESCAALAEAVPPAHVAFLRGLGFSATFGDFFFCHAGVRPGTSLDRQDTQDLIWIRDTFLNHSGLFEKVVVHGHTPVLAPEVLANRVNVDSAAFQSGRLTALAIDGAQKRLFAVKG
ncbi:metallophosphoesterase [Mesorhizobium sp. L-8-3]|uniref:metallophosphoesterase n=1 Tax=Mesorhizobium sp. L-8-3 TaxID=2744522 RepID=UPI0019383808|nr:metallophosphoesterase [Mesorhizobium sp. L-8-3]BCH26609.1 metallophosphatase [Mesorhizobium sp. L-8-3]